MCACVYMCLCVSTQSNRWHQFATPWAIHGDMYECKDKKKSKQQKQNRKYIRTRCWQRLNDSITTTITTTAASTVESVVETEGNTNTTWETPYTREVSLLVTVTGQNMDTSSVRERVCVCAYIRQGKSDGRSNSIKINMDFWQPPMLDKHGVHNG